jgi:N-acetylneuraminate synthase
MAKSIFHRYDDQDETEDLVQFLLIKAIKDLVLYNCTSGYPVPFEDVCF